MEKGVIRFEANVSIRPVGSDELGTRTEIKNLNSFRSMLRAIAFEVERQKVLLEEGRAVVQETLGWDEAREVTLPQRGKEEAHDYRYFPEPDLPPLKIDPGWVARLRADIPELRDAKHQRFVDEFGLTDATADILATDREIAEYFEQAVSSEEDVSAVELANWIIGELFSLLNQSNLEIQDIKLSPHSLAELVKMVQGGEINAAGAKEVLQRMFELGGDPAAIMKELDLGQINDPQVIETLVSQVLDDNPEQVQEYLSGKQALSHWFFGQVMSATKGRANPDLVHSALETSLRMLEEQRGMGV
jgi:aspartyl-tRNA(Asn)/glutamyl-tRNA(Gln) amidotransferase subunit B